MVLAGAALHNNLPYRSALHALLGLMQALIPMLAVAATLSMQSDSMYMVESLAGIPSHSAAFFFLPTAFFGAGSLRFPALTESLKVFPAVKAGELDAGKSKASPVLGFLPVRAGLALFEKAPKPMRRTVFPTITWSMIVSNTAHNVSRFRSGCPAKIWTAGPEWNEVFATKAADTEHLNKTPDITCAHGRVSCYFCLKPALRDHEINEGCLAEDIILLFR